MQDKSTRKVLSSLILLSYIMMMAVSFVSATELFELTHPLHGFKWLMAISTEIAIATLILAFKSNPKIKIVLYTLIGVTLFQMAANVYSAYINIGDYSACVELFNMSTMSSIAQRRCIAAVSGGIIPAMCICLIYIQHKMREDDARRESRSNANNTNITSKPKETASPKKSTASNKQKTYTGKKRGRKPKVKNTSDAPAYTTSTDSNPTLMEPVVTEPVTPAKKEKMSVTWSSPAPNPKDIFKVQKPQ